MAEHVYKVGDWVTPISSTYIHFGNIAEVIKVIGHDSYTLDFNDITIPEAELKSWRGEMLKPAKKPKSKSDFETSITLGKLVDVIQLGPDSAGLKIESSDGREGYTVANQPLTVFFTTDRPMSIDENDLAAVISKLMEVAVFMADYNANRKNRS
jgi:hypothetical protein